MNKRQKKKMDLKLRWENEQKILNNTKDKRPDMPYKNIEGYRDETAYIAIENATRRGY